MGLGCWRFSPLSESALSADSIIGLCWVPDESACMLLATGNPQPSQKQLSLLQDEVSHPPWEDLKHIRAEVFRRQRKAKLLYWLGQWSLGTSRPPSQTQPTKQLAGRKPRRAEQGRMDLYEAAVPHCVQILPSPGLEDRDRNLVSGPLPAFCVPR